MYGIGDIQLHFLYTQEISAISFGYKSRWGILIKYMWYNDQKSLVQGDKTVKMWNVVPCNTPPLMAQDGNWKYLVKEGIYGIYQNSHKHFHIFSVINFFLYEIDCKNAFTEFLCMARKPCHIPLFLPLESVESMFFLRSLWIRETHLTICSLLLFLL